MPVIRKAHRKAQRLYKQKAYSDGTCFDLHFHCVMHLQALLGKKITLTAYGNTQHHEVRADHQKQGQDRNDEDPGCPPKLPVLKVPEKNQSCKSINVTSKCFNSKQLVMIIFVDAKKSNVQKHKKHQSKTRETELRNPWVLFHGKRYQPLNSKVECGSWKDRQGGTQQGPCCLSYLHIVAIHQVKDSNRNHHGANQQKCSGPSYIIHRRCFFTPRVWRTWLLTTGPLQQNPQQGWLKQGWYDHDTGEVEILTALCQKLVRLNQPQWQSGIRSPQLQGEHKIISYCFCMFLFRSALTSQIKQSNWTGSAGPPKLGPVRLQALPAVRVLAPGFNFCSSKEVRRWSKHRKASSNILICMATLRYLRNNKTYINKTKPAKLRFRTLELLLYTWDLAYHVMSVIASLIRSLPSSWPCSSWQNHGFLIFLSLVTDGTKAHHIFQHLKQRSTSNPTVGDLKLTTGRPGIAVVLLPVHPCPSDGLREPCASGSVASPGPLWSSTNKQNHQTNSVNYVVSNVVYNVVSLFANNVVWCRLMLFQIF